MTSASTIGSTRVSILAHEQVKEIGRGKLSASFMHALARFCAWVNACGVDSAEEMRTAKDESVEYFVAPYRAMLIQNLDDYSKNFSKYMRPSQ